MDHITGTLGGGGIILEICDGHGVKPIVLYGLGAAADTSAVAVGVIFVVVGYLSNLR